MEDESNTLLYLYMFNKNRPLYVYERNKKMKGIKETKVIHG